MEASIWPRSLFVSASAPEPAVPLATSATLFAVVKGASCTSPPGAMREPAPANESESASIARNPPVGTMTCPVTVSGDLSSRLKVPPAEELKPASVEMLLLPVRLAPALVPERVVAVIDPAASKMPPVAVSDAVLPVMLPLMVIPPVPALRLRLPPAFTVPSTTSVPVVVFPIMAEDAASISMFPLAETVTPESMVRSLPAWSVSDWPDPSARLVAISRLLAACNVTLPLRASIASAETV